MNEKLKLGLAGTAGRALADLVLGSVRYQESAPAEYHERMRSGEPVVYVLWHGRLLPLTHRNRHRDLVTLISLSRDGEYIARIVGGWGYHVVRGSTSRGGVAALAELIRLGRRGHSIAITPDGPRGPRQRMKPGALLVAQRTGLPVVPAAAAASRAWWFEGWDRFLVPKPFSRVLIEYGAPVRVPRDMSDAGLEELATELEGRLNSMQDRLDAELA